MSTGGEDGVVLTQDEGLAEKIWSYKDHGKDRREATRKDYPPGFRWLHASFGTNWRLTEFQAAICRVQLKKLPTWLERRRKNAQAIRTSTPPQHVEHAYYRYHFHLDPTHLQEG